MNTLRDKLAIKAPHTHVAHRLANVSAELATDPAYADKPLRRFLAQVGTALGGAAAHRAPSAAREGASGAIDALNWTLRPGSEGAMAPVYEGVADTVAKHTTLPRLMIGGSLLTIPFAADEAYLESATIAPLAEAQARGESLMTNPFTSFVQKRAAEKTAASVVPRVFGHGVDLVSELLGSLVTKPGPKVPRQVVNKVVETVGTGDDARKVTRHVLENVLDTSGKAVMDAGPRVFSPLNTAGVVAGAALLGGAADLATGTSSVGSGLEYQLAKQFIPIEDRIQATDTAAEAFLSQSGKNMANLLDEALREGVNVGASAAVHHNRSFNQDLQFQSALESDPLLREATPQDQEMLRRSFNSMARFAPDLATDEFAVKNYLRESMLAANGPDYATLGNMARVNESIAPTTLLPQKPKAAI